jgi:hypothetical protein
MHETIHRSIIAAQAREKSRLQRQAEGKQGSEKPGQIKANALGIVVDLHDTLDAHHSDDANDTPAPAAAAHLHLRRRIRGAQRGDVDEL